jgi:hypothetical protein
MFFRFTLSFVSAATALVPAVLGGPVALRPTFELGMVILSMHTGCLLTLYYRLAPRTLNFPTISGWEGIPSLTDFDNFYGRDNFDGSHSSQVIVKQEQQVVCHSQKIEIIQQQLVVLQEMAKKYVNCQSISVPY